MILQLSRLIMVKHVHFQTPGSKQRQLVVD